MNAAKLRSALSALVNACTPNDTQPNDRGEIRSVRTPEWEIVDQARALLAESSDLETRFRKSVVVGLHQ